MEASPSIVATIIKFALIAGVVVVPLAIVGLVMVFRKRK